MLQEKDIHEDWQSIYDSGAAILRYKNSLVKALSKESL